MNARQICPTPHSVRTTLVSLQAVLDLFTHICTAKRRTFEANRTTTHDTMPTVAPRSRQHRACAALLLCCMGACAHTAASTQRLSGSARLKQCPGLHSSPQPCISPPRARRDEHLHPDLAAQSMSSLTGAHAAPLISSRALVESTSARLAALATLALETRRSHELHGLSVPHGLSAPSCLPSIDASRQSVLARVERTLESALSRSSQVGSSARALARAPFLGRRSSSW